MGCAEADQVPCGPEQAGGELQAAGIQHVQRHRVPQPDLAQDVLDRNGDRLQDHFAGGSAPDPELALLRADAKTGGGGFDEESSEATLG